MDDETAIIAKRLAGCTVCGRKGETFAMDGFCDFCGGFTGQTYYFDINGNAIRLLDWAKTYGNLQSRIIADERPTGKWRIQATFLGHVDPLVDARMFGLAVFDERDFFTGELAQYDTRQGIEMAHVRVVSWMRLNPDTPPTVDTLGKLLETEG